MTPGMRERVGVSGRTHNSVFVLEESSRSPIFAIHRLQNRHCASNPNGSDCRRYSGRRERSLGSRLPLMTSVPEVTLREVGVSVSAFLLQFQSQTCCN